jgi:glycosyltransferase involved in cell wall biosynthesis
MSTPPPAGSEPAQRIGLMMIVRNETAVLPRLAASVSGQIDRWTIVDTGSTDGTQALVRELFAAIPGELIEDEWRGFAASRNVALEAAEPHSDWLLTLDADCAGERTRTSTPEGTGT